MTTNNQITLGGHEFTAEQVIAAIAASNDQNPSCGHISTLTIEELTGVVQGILYRLDSIDDRLPKQRGGFAVATVVKETATEYKVQTIDQNGRDIFITFEIPNT